MRFAPKKIESVVEKHVIQEQKYKKMLKQRSKIYKTQKEKSSIIDFNKSQNIFYKPKKPAWS